MKRLAGLLFVVLLFLCGCSQSNGTAQIDVGSFSYENDVAHYEDDLGVKRSGFVNTQSVEVNDVERIVDLAKKECTVEYDTVRVDFDSESKIWRVSFYKENWHGGNQDVYIDQNGVTQLIVYGE